MNKNLRVYFIRHGKLDLPYKDHLGMPYEVLDDLATSQLDPSISPRSKALFLEAAGNLPLDSFKAIYYNNSGLQSNRSKESAVIIKRVIKDKAGKDLSLFGNPDLKEIDFSLKKILPDKQEFLQKGMPAIRTALYNAEVNNGPVEQTKDIFARIDRIFFSLENHKQKDESVLLVSHDFFMRVVEVYIRKSQDYRKIRVQDLEETTLNKYFKGFGVPYDLKFFERV